MADEVSEQIAQSIYTALQTVTTGNGYTLTVVAVRPTGRDLYTPQDKLAVLQQDDPTRNDEWSVSGNPVADAWDLVYTIDVWRAVDETSTVAMDKLLSNAWADVIKAIMADETHGGIALMTAPQPRVTTYYEGGAFEGVRCELSVTYRTDQNDPTVTR